MQKFSRRDFLGGMSGALLLPLGRVEPQTILYNGNIITIDNGQPRAQAVAIADGRFLAVGTNDEVRALATGRTKKIDLGGKTVVPGFIDAHTHPVYSGIRHMRRVDADLR